MGEIRYIKETARITFNHPNLYYFDYPATVILGFAYSTVVDLGNFETRFLLLVFGGFLFLTLVYVMYSRSLKSSMVGVLGTLLLTHGNLMVARSNYFWPRNMGLSLLASLLILIYARKYSTARDKLLLTILSAALLWLSK